jgi:hypothetical protein
MVFDLSHGLPTGYNDFVKYLIKKEVFNFIDGFPKNFTHKDLYHKYFGDLIIKDPEMKNYFRNNTYYTKGDYELKYFEKLKSEINADPINNLFLHFNKHPENEFIIKVLDSKHHLWGKIEILYFDLLKKYYKKINPEKNQY